MKFVLLFVLFFSTARADEAEPLVIRVRPRAATASSSSPSGAKAEDCNPAAPASAPDGAALSESKTGMANDIAVATGAYSLDDVEDLLGHCVSVDGQSKIAQRRVIPRLIERMKNPGKAMGRRPGDGDYLTEMPKVRKDSKEFADQADWIAVDMLARTIYSEVGSNIKCGDEYVNAVGKIILNRVDASQKNAAVRKMFMKGVDEEMPDAHPVVPVVLASSQFDVWTAGSPAGRWAACPAKHAVQKYAFADSNGVKPVSGWKSNDMWRRSLMAAAQMIFQQNSFRKATAGFTATEYSVGDAAAALKRKQCYKPAADIIGGKRVNRSDCMQAWVAPTLSEQKACTTNK